MSLKEFLIGKRLRTEAEQEEQIGTLTGIPVLGLDALASASYGPVMNAIGAAATGLNLLIMVASKFREGAWITVLIIPPLMVVFQRVRRYHEQLERETDAGGPLEVHPMLPTVIVIPMKRMNRVTRKALRLAMSLSTEVRAVQIVAEEIKTEDLADCWDRLVEDPARAAGYKPPYLTVVHSPYREFFGPLLKVIEELGEEYPDRVIAVMLPEMVERRWYHFLFRHRSTFLKALLLLRGGPRIALITTPWYVHDAEAGKEISPRVDEADTADKSVVVSAAE